MTTESRPWKKDVTKGEWESGWNGHTCAVWGVAIVLGFDTKQCNANRELIAEAGTTLHQTGMTPGELAERVEMLEELIKGLRRGLDYYADILTRRT